jgi:hypothetical protein
MRTATGLIGIVGFAEAANSTDIRLALRKCREPAILCAATAVTILRTPGVILCLCRLRKEGPSKREDGEYNFQHECLS